jgi:hypothetical protein
MEKSYEKMWGIGHDKANDIAKKFLDYLISCNYDI